MRWDIKGGCCGKECAEVVSVVMGGSFGGGKLEYD